MAYNQPYNYGYGYPQYQNGAVPDMLGQYKGQYQQPIIQQPMVQQTQAPIHTNDMIWVLNENEATSYPVAPNNSVVLWDKNNKTFYIKTANAQGIPSMQIYDFTQRIENAPKSPTEHVCKCGNDFIPKSELNAINGKFDDISGKIEELEHKIKEMSVKPMPKTTKTTKTEE